MKIDTYDIDEFVDINKLKPVTSSVLFERGGIPNSEGLLSNEIFGITVGSRRDTFAYIDLGAHFLSPAAYKPIRFLYRNIDKLISGEQSFIINKRGNLEPSVDENAGTGLEWLYENYSKINWDTSEDADAATTGMRAERLGLLKELSMKETFITKFPVLPVYYRDIKSTSSGGETGDLNKYYANIIRLTTLIKDRSMFDFQFHATNFEVQRLLVEIWNYFKAKLEKKNGMIRKYLMGKTIDNCVRSIIVAPQFHGETYQDTIVDFYHAAVPISQVCVLAYPFMMKWIKDFFERELFDAQNMKMLYDVKNGEVVTFNTIKTPANLYDEKAIKKIMDTYIRDPSSRFNRLPVPIADSNREFCLVFTGHRVSGGKEETSGLIKRYMTITDLLYLAACDVTRDKHCLDTRYPILNEFSTMILKMNISSTVKTEPVMVNGRLYKWYPIIDETIPKKKMASYFIDAFITSLSLIKGQTADFDGDQVTIKMVFSQEANNELDAYMKSVSYFIDSSGRMIRMIESEAVHTFYTMTKEYKDGRELTSEEQAELLNYTMDDYTFSRLVAMFGTTYDRNKTKRNPRFHLGDKMTLPAGKYGNKEPIKTTVGYYVCYSILYGSPAVSKFIKYDNVPLKQGNVDGNQQILADKLQTEELKVSDMVEYQNRRDWLGLQLHSTICASFTPDILFLDPSIKKRRAELFEKNKEILASGNGKAAESIEKELIAMAKEKLKGDPGMDLYDSGARGSMGNNYKNLNLIRGPVFNEETKKYDMIANSLMDGLSKKDFTAHANSLINGAYPKSVGTAESGYLGKELNAIMQNEVLDSSPTSDCGTKLTMTIKLPDNLGDAKQFLYRFIVEGGKYVHLTPEVLPKYIGKIVKMRSLLYCKNPSNHLCAICAGTYYHNIKKPFIGLQTFTLSTNMTNAKMKKFHDNTVHTSKIDPQDLLF